MSMYDAKDSVEKQLLSKDVGSFCAYHNELRKKLGTREKYEDIGENLCVKITYREILYIES